MAFYETLYVSTAEPSVPGNVSVPGEMNVSIYPQDATTAVQAPLLGSYTLQLMRKVCELWLSFPLAVLGIIGNLLALLVLSRHKPRLTTTMLLQALAITDTFVLLMTITLRSSRYINLDIQLDVTWQRFFRFGYPFLYFVRLMDTWITVLLTVDRYIAVCHPLSATRLCTRTRTYILIAVSVVLGLIFSLPRFFEFKMTSTFDPKSNRTIHYMSVSDLNNNQHYLFVYRIGLFFVAMYLVPMLMLIILNGKLLVALRDADVRRSHMAQGYTGGSTSQHRGNKTNRSVTVIVVTVVLVCIMCNTCAMIVHTLWSVELCFKRIKTLTDYRRYISNISNVLVTLNSAINFVIYCMFSRNFRSVLVRVFCTCFRSRRPMSLTLKQRSSSGGTLNSSLSRLSSNAKVRKPGSQNALPEMSVLLRTHGGSTSVVTSRCPSPRAPPSPCTPLTPVTPDASLMFPQKTDFRYVGGDVTRRNGDCRL